MKIYQVKPGILSYTPLSENQTPIKPTHVGYMVLANFLDKEFNTKRYTALANLMSKRLATFNIQLLMFDIASAGGLDGNTDQSNDRVSVQKG